MKNTWRGIKQLIRRKSGKRAQCPQNIVINNKTITDPKTIAEAFNEYFASVGSKLAQTIPHVNKSYVAYLHVLNAQVFTLTLLQQRKLKKKSAS